VGQLGGAQGQSGPVNNLARTHIVV